MEEILHIGDGNGFGLLTRAQGDGNGLAVILFNAGLIHRSGPQRFHVELARRLASQGFDVFRFDLPGIGDAAMDGAALPQTLVSRVFDRLQAATGAHGFLVGGICSAADLGWRMGVADERVRGLLLVDPFAAKGRWYRMGRLRMALRSPLLSWPAKLLRRLRPGQGAATEVPATEDFRDWPSAAEYRRQAGELLSRGVRILAVYTGGVPDYMTHPRQLDETYGALLRHPGLEAEFRPGVDHILFAVADRRSLVERIARWATAHAAAGATSTA